MLQSYPEGVAQERHHHMRLGPWFLLMKPRPDGKLAFQRAKGGFGLSKLHVLRPELLGGTCRQIGPQHVRTFPQIPPSFRSSLISQNRRTPSGVRGALKVASCRSPTAAAARVIPTNPDT